MSFIGDKVIDSKMSETKSQYLDPEYPIHNRIDRPLVEVGVYAFVKDVTIKDKV